MTLARQAPRGPASRSTSSSRWGPTTSSGAPTTGFSLEVRTSAERLPRPGERLTLGLDPRRVSLFATEGGARL